MIFIPYSIYIDINMTLVQKINSQVAFYVIMYKLE